MAWPFKKQIIEAKESASAALVYLQTLGRPVWTPRQYDKLAEEAYMKNVVAYRCVRMISEGAASVPWLLYEGEKELSEHPLLSLLARPNPMEGGSEFFERFYSFYLLAGNSYMEGMVLDKELKELWVLRPDRMTIELGRRGYPSAYIYTVGSNKYRYDVDISRFIQQSIMHFRAFHPTNDHFGLSPVEAGAFAIDVHNAAGGYNKSLLDNQARPSGALVYSGGKDGKGTLSTEQFNRLQKDLEERHSGTQNAGRPMLLEGGLDWKQMGMSPQDLEFTEGKREAAREVALAFGVPPMLLGIPGDNTYANYQEANRAFYRQTVLPLVGKACMSITNWAAPTYGDSIKLWYDIDEVQALSSEREAVWDKVKEATWLTIDEKRKATGYDPYKSPKDPEKNPGEVLLVSTSQSPIDDLTLTMGGDPEETPPPDQPKEGDE